jgi:hypothetical protein
MRKRIISILLILLLSLGFSTEAFATGDGNVDTGGGSAGNTDNRVSYWRTDATGYRVSFVDKTNGSIVGHAADYMMPKSVNQDNGWSGWNGIIFHNGNYSNKIQLRNNPGALSLSTAAYSPEITDFQWRGKSQAQLIAFFTGENTINQWISATGCGLSVATLTNGEGKYKILVEPMAVVKLSGQFYALTATEFAILSEGGMAFRTWLGSVTAGIVPNGMFLAFDSNTNDPDDRLGLLKPPSGINTNGINSNSNIRQYLGMGLVKFDTVVPPPPSADPNTTLIYVEQNGTVRRSTENIYGSSNRVGGSNWYNYFNTVTEYPVEYESKYREYSFTHLIKASQATYQEREVYRTEWDYWTDDEGNDHWYSYQVFDHYEYDQLSKSSSSVTTIFRYTPPHPYYMEYLPLELSVERNMTPSEYGNYGRDGYGYILGAVDNGQTETYPNIAPLQTLDVNVNAPFKLTLNNNQFGIPTAAQDGIDILASRPYQVITEGNSKSMRNQIGARGDLNIQLYYGAEMYVSGAGKGDGSSSLIEAGHEYADTDILTKLPGWRGDQFGFKNIKVGEYILGRPILMNCWHSEFSMGIYYDYGAHYYTMVRVGGAAPIFTGAAGVNSPAQLGPYLGQNWKNEDFWVSEVWDTAYQPILYGRFLSKTVGGNIG